jgi:hypothetical protein
MGWLTGWLAGMNDCPADFPQLLQRISRQRFQHRVRRSTLADANKRRDGRIFSDFGAWQLQRAQRLYAEANRRAVYPLGQTVKWRRGRDSNRRRANNRNASRSVVYVVYE